MSLEPGPAKINSQTPTEEQAEVAEVEKSEFDALKELWKNTRREGDPEIKFQFAFGAHAVGRDLEHIKKLFKDCDIYIPEALQWDKGVLSFYRALSSGLIDLKQDKTERNIFHRFTTALDKMIDGSGKIITFVDIPADHRILTSFQDLQSSFKREYALAKDLSEKIRIIKNHTETHSKIECEREKYILQQIPLRIREALDENQKLKNKSVITVLLSLGSGHASFPLSVSHLVNEKVGRFFPARLYNFGFVDEAMRRIMLKKSINGVDTDFWAKVWLETEFLESFSKSMFRNFEESGEAQTRKIIRNTIDSFSFNDAQEINDQINKGKKFRQVFLDACKRKGLKVGAFM